MVMRFVKLTKEETILVEKLYKNSDGPVVRERCLFLKLSLQNKSMMEISRILQVGRLRVTLFFDAWEKAESPGEKTLTLQIKKGRGAKNKLISVQETIPDLVKENNRNLNAVLSILAEKHQINVCKVTLQNFLKEERV